MSAYQNLTGLALVFSGSPNEPKPWQPRSTRLLQWRIQDFPGAPTPENGTLTYYFPIYMCRKLHENESIWTDSEHASLAIALRSPPPPHPWIHHCPFRLCIFDKKH